MRAYDGTQSESPMDRFRRYARRKLRAGRLRAERAGKRRARREGRREVLQ